MSEILTLKQLKDSLQCIIEDNLECSQCSCSDGSDYVCLVNNGEAEETALTLYEMLKRLEFVEDEHGNKQCKICFCTWEHKPDCELGNLIKIMEG